MTKSSKIREIDLKPYQTHFLFQSAGALTSKRIEQLLKELPTLIDEGLEDEDDQCKILAQSLPRVIKDEQIAWLAYSKRVKVRWAVGPDVPKDLEHHLVVLTARSLLLSVVATDKSLGAKLTRGGVGKEWKTLHRVSFGRLERALVSGNTRTLWLSGIHRSVATKADSKVLIGPDVESSLDALGDQSYQYTSTRCQGPDALPASFVGVTPRMAKVWLGPSADWEVFLANSQRLLQLIESPGAKKETPYPVLARAEGSLKDVKDAFDVSLAPPEYLYDEHPDVVTELENLLQQASWAVQPASGADCVLALKLPDGIHNFKIEIRAEGGGIQHTVTATEKEPSQEVEKIAALLGRADLLKIFYDSLHTFSDGQIFEVKTRPFPFPVKDGDFSKFEITLEKPRPAGKSEGLDLSRIGVAGEPSLFTWVWRHYKQGWLWCDDGSGEIADFIHLDPGKSTLSLIHVKAANSNSPKRGISVSAYEVVCSQALKNLRYTERRELEQPLKEKIESADAKIVRGWRNGKALSLRSTDLWSAIKNVRYSELTRRVVIVQPHVRKSLLPANLSDNTSAARQARLLYTLLYGIKADVDRYGVQFEVVVDK
jgi:hypothetical protein